MQSLKRLAWLFLAGFVTVMGAGLAVFIAVFLFESSNRVRDRIDPQNYQPPKPGEITFSEIKLTRLTHRGGVFGFVENRTKRDLRSFNADLSLSRNGVLLHRCTETVAVSVNAGARATFELVCSNLDRTLLTSDIQPAIDVNWVFPSLDK